MFNSSVPVHPSFKVLPLIAAILILAGCSGRIGWYSNYEIAGKIAREEGPRKAEEWLADTAGPEEARQWRERYDRAVKRSEKGTVELNIPSQK